MLKVSGLSVVSRRSYGLWGFTHPREGPGVRLFHKTLLILGAPVGILAVHFAFKNEHHHEEEMKENKPFISVYPREIRKLHWGDGKTYFTDHFSKTINYTPRATSPIPKSAD
ncbi:unnamed protein product [Schistosoma rodhaini]|uniref:Cytochrome c oxidase subunit 6A1, mitochondrial n=2 Tax=Schistosoma TaxID=6181 RepID=G4VFB1_SCHMA|nr:hypothetical protein Smp_087550 [Schistosoma mansoni]CAH8557787.1 unnamed protein product [Schistosoma rodhaini]CAH8558154.1 unnamed protein product [Schistosoma rodhaini]|eukprot:XP_018651229.1 hypothetical protein Smp_087550 [Schistosoma mansoni]